MSELGVVICGAGIAGAEGALRLRRLAGERCAITIVDPTSSTTATPARRSPASCRTSRAATSRASSSSSPRSRRGRCRSTSSRSCLAAQQADTAAAGIAHLAGAVPQPVALSPTLRGMLLTGRKPLYLAAHADELGTWQSEVYDEPPWPADEKVIAEELGPYLGSRDEAVPRP